MITVNCKYCGKPFDAPSYEVKIGRKKYCSRECANNAQRNLKYCKNCGKSYFNPKHTSHSEYCSKECSPKYNSIEKICPNCGKIIQVRVSSANRYTYCSIECRKADTREFVCIRCGKKFKRPGKQTAMYCSKLCVDPPVIVNCLTCGKEFRRSPSETTRRYCSYSCYHYGSKTESSLEKTTREALTKIGINFIQEFQVGRYSLDFYFPNHFIALEVDGDYWHKDKTKDKRRDKILIKHGITVIRVSEKDINSSSNLIYLLKSRLSKYLQLNNLRT